MSSIASKNNAYDTMRLKLIILLLFVTSVAFGQVNYTPSGNALSVKDTVINGVSQKTYKGVTYKGAVEYWPTRGWVLGQQPTQYGSIYTKETWTSGTLASDFTTIPSTTTATVSLIGGNLSFTTNGIKPYNYVTRLERWKNSQKIVIGTKNATPTLIQVGVKGYNQFAIYDGYVAFDASTGAGAGKLQLIGGFGTVVATSSTAISFSSGDTILLTCEKDRDYIKGSVVNLTTKTGSVSVSFYYDVATTGNRPNTAMFFSGITSSNGMVVDSMAITSNETVNSTVAFVGDSKTVWAGADEIGTSFSRKLMNYYQDAIVLAGGSDRTQQMVDGLPELLRLGPKNVVLCGPGINDILGGVSAVTWKANITSMVSQLQAARINVYILDGIYDPSGTNQIYSYIHATYPESMIISTFKTGQATPNSVIGDNVHPSQIGHDIVFDAVLSSGKIINAVNSPFLPRSAGITNPVGELYAKKLISYGNIEAIGKLSWGTSTYTSSSIFNTAVNGTVFASTIGSVDDLLIINGNGSTLIQNPTGTQDLKVYGQVINSKHDATTTGVAYYIGRKAQGTDAAPLDYTTGNITSLYGEGYRSGYKAAGSYIISAVGPASTGGGILGKHRFFSSDNSSNFVESASIDYQGNLTVAGEITQGSVLSSLLKTNSSGNIVAAVAGTDYMSPGGTAATYAPINNPTFTGTVSAPSFSGPLTGNSSTTTLAANSTKWNNQDYTAAESSSVNSYLLGFTASGDWRPTTLPAIKSYLGLPVFLTGSTTIDFGTIAGNSESVSSVTVTGAAVGNVVMIGIPYSSGNIPPGVVFTGYVSAPNQVSIRANNTYTTTSTDPPSGVFTVKVFQTD